eukprot:Hpha_TRINITY_DN16275_c2_g12::TRINITY_DN16275_c2_g12_i1::g.16142::m.16142/K08857/NEK1_4_5; NIMA (never in mitosis gene a)-related kinase 1/4/5
MKSIGGSVGIQDPLKGTFATLLGDPGDESARFSKVKKIGSGSHGDAFQVTDRTATTTDRSGRVPRYVAKVMRLHEMSQRDLRYAYSEVRCMSLLNHANIVGYIADFETAESLIIVMEYADGGDLERQVKARAARDLEFFKEHEVIFIFLQLSLALDHVHGRKMLHRDLKTANVFLTAAGVVKLGDFGYSHEYAETVSNIVAGTFCGTPVYLAPELWNSERYSKKADIWSLGVVLYEMLALRRPYYSSNMMELMEMILKEEFPPPPPHYTEDMIDLTHFILRKDPGQRPTVRQTFQVDYIQKGLRQLADTVKRNTLISAQVKDCIVSHVDNVLEEAARERTGVAPRDTKRVGKGELLVVLGGQSGEWQQAQVEVGEELSVFTKTEEFTLAPQDITNACPIGLQESQHPNTFGVFLVNPPHIIWFRCDTDEETSDWLGAVLNMVGI